MASTPAVEPESASTNRRLGTAALIVLVATAASRVFGYAREIVAAKLLPLDEKSAFDVAFLVPSTIQILVAQAALTAALIPVFAGLLDGGERREAWRVARTVFTIVTLALSLLVAVCLIFAPQIMPFFAPGYRDNPEMMADIVRMTRLLFPTVILLAMGGIVTSILNSFEHFTLPAIAPVVWNLVIVLALVFGYDRLGVDALAWGVLLGTVLQLLIQLPGLRGRGGRLGIGLDWRNPHVKKVAALMLPVSLSLGLINLNGVVNVQFASLIDENAVAAMNYAFRLYQLPEALFAIAVGTVLFPTLSKLAARRETAAFRSTISLGIRVIFFLLLPATALMLVLSEPMVRLVYQRGQFDAQTTVLVASALFFFAFGSAFSGGSALLTRGFFSLRRSWVPTGLAVFNLGLNALLNWLLYKPLGLAGISLATSVVSLVTFLLLLWLMRRQLGRLDGRLIAKSGIAAALLSLVVAAAAYLCWWGLDHWLGRATVAQVASLGGALSVAACLFLALAWTFKLPELKLITAMRGK